MLFGSERKSEANRPFDPSMSTLAACVGSLLLLAFLCLSSKAADPAVEERLANLEAYFRGSPASSGLLAGLPGPGHNAWMMTSAALVLFMTLPGLALFYGGLVRRKNVLSILGQCLGLSGLVIVLWWVCGYSLSFAPGTAVIGGWQWAFLKNVGAAPNTDYGAWVSHNVFAMYQMMFAIITPALFIGAVAERMKFKAIVVFSLFWMFLVYFPTVHMVWGIDGWMNGLGNPLARIKAIDFAGGIVVHMTSGWSALVLCLLLGPRQGHGREAILPHSLVLCTVGTGMLWFGWYGFNAGSAVAASGVAANAFTATTLSAGVGLATWALLEQWLRGNPSILGMCSGAVAGLATITPASGFVTANGAILIGLLSGVSTYLACAKLKAFFKYDDSLDTFGVHAVGGTLGTLMAGFLATPEANPALGGDAIKGLVGNGLWLEQVKAGSLVLVGSCVITIILYRVTDTLVGCRVNDDAETQGLDLAEHGEPGYDH